ncbi:MAG: hypothetical protein V4511_07835 [Bacteroidota bacterium]
MRSKTVFFAIILFAITFKTYAQEFISSNVRVFRETGETISYSENEMAVIKLNPQTNQFRVDFCVFLIQKNDTLKETNQQLSLDFRGLFPISDLDFYDLEGESRKTYTIIGELTINNITRSYTKIDFALHRSNFPNIYSPNVLSYPYNISFQLEINPIDFCLESILPNCPRTIFVEVKDGIINKFSNGNGKSECKNGY